MHSKNGIWILLFLSMPLTCRAQVAIPFGIGMIQINPTTSNDTYQLANYGPPSPEPKPIIFLKPGQNFLGYSSGAPGLLGPGQNLMYLGFSQGKLVPSPLLTPAGQITLTPNPTVSGLSTVYIKLAVSTTGEKKLYLVQYVPTIQLSFIFVFNLDLFESRASKIIPYGAQGAKVSTYLINIIFDSIGNFSGIKDYPITLSSITATIQVPENVARQIDKPNITMAIRPNAELAKINQKNDLFSGWWGDASRWVTVKK